MGISLKIIGSLLKVSGLLLLALPVVVTLVISINGNQLTGPYIDQLNDDNRINTYLQLNNVSSNTYDPSLQPFIGQALNIQDEVNSIDRSCTDQLEPFLNAMQFVDNLRQFDLKTHTTSAWSLLLAGFLLVIFGTISCRM